MIRIYSKAKIVMNLVGKFFIFFLDKFLPFDISLPNGLINFQIIDDNIKNLFSQQVGLLLVILRVN